ncbi:RNA polymerase sigma-70 factor (ECF subfamily) [Lipingzhangella halophila]|uniref:RNA polymerase sigma-70 factor (ECF subfamily) n=1 Tax=Lipingzhangella halophila TaxID=1783352 RepID=A0A7W7RPR1_9ACTN|nr:sigma-70 family RNA polymerase sigma factor [Lipingzhangella halophila]MBB4935378.1 RNA polymerase sigma-70 factor (ECF subfamily) [Lipingzhangella halophila]
MSGDFPTSPQPRLSRLFEALDTGDGTAARRELTEFLADEHTRDDVLDLLARQGADGSGLAVELLAETVDELGLARRAASRMLVDEAAVDDVAQETLISMATSIHSFRGDSKFTTWLYQVTRRRVVDYLRRQRADIQLDTDEVSPAQRISSMIASRETARQLVDRLPELYRAAVVLRDVERLSYDEVAQRLGRNTNTVKSHVARGRALLARMLGSGDRE